jgi:hypothetical protein
MALHDAAGRHWSDSLPQIVRARGRVFRAIAMADADLASLLLLASVPLLAGVGALIAPGRILSREMTWDFLFNLAGAWHLHYGHVAHVDFHGPVGVLNFLLTLVGFAVVGPTPLAFLVGAIIVALAVFVLASWAAWRRLPLLPAVIFVTFTTLLVLMPANVGDRPTDFSFAMSYNRYCWSAISILALILFIPPRSSQGVDWRSDWRSDWGDVAAGGILLVAMFYLKMTYFVAGLASVGFAVALFPHVRSWWGAWAAIGGLTVANALAPHSRAYLLDICGAVHAGGVRTGLALHINNFFANSEGYAAYVAAFVATFIMYLRGITPFRLAAATGFIFVLSLALLSQNAQLRGAPLGIVVAFLFYDQLRELALQKPSSAMKPLLLALMVFPLLSIGVSSVSLVGYLAKARSEERLLVIDHTQLKGLAVWAEDGKLLEAFANGRIDYKLLNSARHVGTRYELSPFEYVETIMQAASLLQDGRHLPGSVVLLDQINPLPFMLGIEPSRGGTLWLGLGEPLPEATTLFASADHVLIPKFPTYSDATEAAMLEYGAYIAKHFPHREETKSWIVLSRNRAVRGSRSHVPLSPAAFDP